MSNSKISLVVPVFNEEKLLPEQCKKYRLLQKQGVEVVIVDGGSTDSSIDIIKKNKLTLLQSSCGRAWQMNVGADYCSGSSVLFLHVDSDVPGNFLEYLDIISQAPWGFFYLTLSNTNWIFRLVSSGINFRSNVYKVATGDQGIFVRADIFKETGGFRNIELMEDIDLTRRLKKYYNPLIIPEKIVSSARRWESRGVIKTAFLMWFLQLAFKVGVSPKRLLRWYK